MDDQLDAHQGTSDSSMEIRNADAGDNQEPATSPADTDADRASQDHEHNPEHDRPASTSVRSADSPPNQIDSVDQPAASQPTTTNATAPATRVTRANLESQLGMLKQEYFALRKE